MTENPRTSLLRRARRRTAAIVLGTLAGTGLLTVGIAATTQQATGDDGDTTSDTTSESSEHTSDDTSDDTSEDTSGSTSDTQQPSGVSPGTSSGKSDGGTHSS